MMSTEEKILACWLGKGIGGTLGMPFEGSPRELDCSFHHMSGVALPNDDLELQLLWLWVLETQGPSVRAAELAQAASDHYVCYPDEYAVARWNSARGFLPPDTGRINNWFGDGMGAAIRSEIWACLFPGKPALAAAFAREDAITDHWGNGVYAEIFLAALESHLFADARLFNAIEAALAFIPPKSKLSQALQCVVKMHQKGESWRATRNMILSKFPSHNFTDVTLNLSFILIGLLYGDRDFERSLILAVNCGMDTDCTGATCGSILGIQGGKEAIPPQWHALGEQLAISDCLKHLPLPETATELTRRTCALSERLQKEYSETLIDPTPDVKKEPNDDREWMICPVPQEQGMEIPVNGGESSVCVRGVGLELNLDPFIQTPGDHIFLKTHMKAEWGAPNAQLMMCADTGITVWIDGQQVLNYHGRQQALPAFHRTEGGATIPFQLEAGRTYEVLVRLIGCTAPLSYFMALGDAEGRFVHPVQFSVPFVRPFFLTKL